MGRKKIAIKKIEDLTKRYVAFSKRKDGLFKKADTACRMYGSQIGIIVFSPTVGKLHTFGPVDPLIDQFLHQSSSPPPPPHLNSEGKKRSRSGDDDDRVPMMPAERETKKKRKLLMSTTTTTTEAAAATEVEEEKEGFLLIKNSEIEEDEGLMMKNEFMGFEQNVDYTMGGSSSSTAMTASTVASSSFLESDVHDDDDELDEVLNGFADYIIADHPYYEETMFDMLPHQGVNYDDDQGCFTFCDNWPTIDFVQDQLLS